MIIGKVNARSQPVADIFFRKLMLKEPSVPVIRVNAGNSMNKMKMAQMHHCHMLRIETEMKNINRNKPGKR